MHDIFQDTIYNIKEYKTSSISYGYEVEGEYDDMQYNEDLDEINVQDLSKINNMFNKAGCGLTNDEAHLIGITIDQMSQLGKFKNIRYLHNTYILDISGTMVSIVGSKMIMNIFLFPGIGVK